MKSDVFTCGEDWRRWRGTIKWCIPDWLEPRDYPCIAVLIPGEGGCADVDFVYYSEFQVVEQE